VSSEKRPPRYPLLLKVFSPPPLAGWKPRHRQYDGAVVVVAVPSSRVSSGDRRRSTQQSLQGFSLGVSRAWTISNGFTEYLRRAWGVSFRV